MSHNSFRMGRSIRALYAKEIQNYKFMQNFSLPPFLLFVKSEPVIAPAPDSQGPTFMLVTIVLPSLTLHSNGKIEHYNLPRVVLVSDILWIPAATTTLLDVYQRTV